MSSPTARRTPSPAAIRVLERVPHPLLVLVGDTLDVAGASAPMDDLVGGTAGVLRGRALVDVLPSLSRAQVEEASRGGGRLDGVVCRRTDGTRVSVDVAVRALPEDDGGGFVLSVDARPMALSRVVDAAAGASELGALTTQARIDTTAVAAVKDARGVYQAVTLFPAGTKQHAGTIVGRTDAEFIPPELAKLSAASDALARSTPDSVVVLEKTDGERPFRIYKAALTVEGTPHLFVLNTDLREERARLAQLAESEARHRALLDASPDLMLVISKDDEFLDYHVGFESTLYAPPEQFLGRRVADVMPADLTAAFERTARAARAERRPLSFEYDLDIRGSRKTCEARVVPCDDDRIILVSRDVTDARRARALEQKLVHAQRLEALGVLAGGVAHDFNNVLAAVVGFAETLRARLERDPAAAALASDILQASFRGRDLVGQILTFARRTEAGRRPLALGAVARDAAKLLRAGLPAITVHVHVDDDVPTVFAEPADLHRVVVNLVTNGAQASRATSHARVEVRASARVIRDEEPDTTGIPAGRYAVLSVVDRGDGMDGATRARMFDPFFTTRAPGEGTGLGLSVVHGIVRAHGGFLLVRSAPGEGTTVDVLLPTTDAVPPPEDALATTPSPLPATAPGPKPRVLVVEDDPNVARSFGLLLETIGFDATVEQDPRTAAARARETTFDLVVTDLAMPCMNGVEVARAIQEVRPGLPVLLVTGNAMTLDAALLGSVGIVSTLPKPVSMDQLEQAITSALSAARRRVPRDRA